MSQGLDYEVELKFRLPSADDVLTHLQPLGVTFAAPVEQHDTYFNHPARDFAQTDEAFRIRSVGDEHRLTYKGPKIDEQTKTRLEIEVPIATGEQARQQMSAMLLALGFREVRTVVKHRQTGHLQWEDRAVEVALDDVPQVGQFIELETLAAESDWQAARDSLLRLADQLQLTEFERRSYLQLLMESV